MGTGQTLGMVGGGAAGTAVAGPAGTVPGAMLGAGVGGLLDPGPSWNPGGVQQDWSAAIQARMNALAAREQQNQLAQMLLARAKGQTPSLAELQLNQGTQKNIAAAQSLAGSATGGMVSKNLAQMQAQQAQQNAISQGSADTALLRLQEQQAAEQQLASLWNQQRAQDLQSMDIEAGMQQQSGALQAGLLGQRSQLEAEREKSKSGLTGGLLNAGGTGLMGILSNKG